VPRAPPPARRAGSYDHFLNFQIVFVILLQLALCVFCAVASYIWREKSGIRHYDLALDADVQAQCPPALRPLCGHTSDVEPCDAPLYMATAVAAGWGARRVALPRRSAP